MRYRAPQEDLERALRALPQSVSSADFTDRTLAALEQRPSRTDSRRARVWMMVGAVALVASLVLGYRIERHRAAERDYQQQVEALRTRYQELLVEVTSVRRAVTAPATRVYLGGSEDLDLVLDLSQLQTPTEPGRRVPTATPASLEQ